VKTWRFAAVTETSLRRLPDGRVAPHCDPAIMQQLLLHPHDHDARDHYDAQNISVRCLGEVNPDLVLCVTAQASVVRPWPLAESACLTHRPTDPLCGLSAKSCCRSSLQSVVHLPRNFYRRDQVVALA